MSTSRPEVDATNVAPTRSALELGLRHVPLPQVVRAAAFAARAAFDAAVAARIKEARTPIAARLRGRHIGADRGGGSCPPFRTASRAASTDFLAASVALRIDAFAAEPTAPSASATLTWARVAAASASVASFPTLSEDCCEASSPPTSTLARRGGLLHSPHPRLAWPHAPPLASSISRRLGAPRPAAGRGAVPSW